MWALRATLLFGLLLATGMAADPGTLDPNGMFAAQAGSEAPPSDALPMLAATNASAIPASQLAPGAGSELNAIPPLPTVADDPPVPAETLLLPPKPPLTRAQAKRDEAKAKREDRLNTGAAAIAPQAMAPTFADILKSHNAYRANHLAPALAWSDAIAAKAQAFANRCIWADSRTAGVGENMFATTGADAAAALQGAMNGWYAESFKYNWAKAGFSSATGHFTQLVWKASTQMGCGVASCKSGLANLPQGRTVVVCHYSPRGNIVGQFPKNVLPKTSAPPPVAWTGDWAKGCDWVGGDLSSAQVASDKCGPLCVNTKGCSHFTWTKYNGGTCWMKKGTVSKADAVPTSDQDMLCGVAPDWNGNNWALACDFKGGDMGNAKTTSDQCGPTCQRTPGCTHFTWTGFNGGTCWMKGGAASKLDAFTTTDTNSICGLLRSAPPPGGGSLMGVCYDAAHAREYPLNGGALGDLAAVMDVDFKQMADAGIKYVRTYFSEFYGVRVAPAAAKYGIKLHLGVMMTNEGWYANQVASAVSSVRDFPATVEALLVGNENVQPAGPYTADEIIKRMADLRAAVQSGAGGRSVPVGTVQRLAEWADVRNAAVGRLGAAADVIGVNAYTFFGGHDYNNPIRPLNDQWQAVVRRFGPDKLRLTETGFPTAGGAAGNTNINGDLGASRAFYAAVADWVSKGGTGNKAIFWFAAYDRRPDDNTIPGAFEKFFGLWTHDRRPKGVV